MNYCVARHRYSTKTRPYINAVTNYSIVFKNMLKISSNCIGFTVSWIHFIIIIDPTSIDRIISIRLLMQRELLLWFNCYYLQSKTASKLDVDKSLDNKVEEYWLFCWKTNKTKQNKTKTTNYFVVSVKSSHNKELSSTESQHRLDP